LTIKWNGARIDAFLHAKTVSGGRERVFPDSFDWGWFYLATAAAKLRLCGAHCMITNFQWYVKKPTKVSVLKHKLSGRVIEKKGDRSLERRAILLM